MVLPGVSPLQTPAAPRPAHLSGRETRFASINFITSQDDSKSTKPGVIQPLARVRQNAASHNSEDGDSPNPFQQPEPCSGVQNSQKPPSPPSPDEIPINVKQAYKTFAAVPLSHPLLETQVSGAGLGMRLGRDMEPCGRARAA
ncbi:scribble-like protein [Patagioenas fasciata monilis]|uniref:Scribble-like protein n=1 Tax=Patagioenas fasciata monilis TaxID=372326 RepID=A0A1V4JVQ2_PATFA|nr:scribble-like protein [Patagioenas fasciata monilis]